MNQQRLAQQSQMRGNSNVGDFAGNEDPSTRELNGYVQNLLSQMQGRFEEMSGNIVGRIDEMRKRIDDIEKSVSDLMTDLQVDDHEAESKHIRK